MESLIQRIKQDQIQARKDRNKEAAATLTTLLGEAIRIGKDDGNRETTDDEVMKLIRKFIKGNNDIIHAYQTDSIKRDISEPQKEIELLTQYLPVQLSETELTTIIKSIMLPFEKPTMKDIGRIMAALKKGHDGTFDGKTASNIIKQFLQ